VTHQGSVAGHPPVRAGICCAERIPVLRRTVTGHRTSLPPLSNDRAWRMIALTGYLYLFAASITTSLSTVLLSFFHVAKAGNVRTLLSCQLFHSRFSLSVYFSSLAAKLWQSSARMALFCLEVDYGL